jgi:serine/threonine-protein kinase
LVEGEDLHAIIKSGALSWEDFRYVSEQCMEPLVAAGDLNLLHRDIKPGNIMLTVTASGRFLAKLLDFGLAKFSQQPSVQTLDQRGSFLGSIDFIAPEQLELRPLDQGLKMDDLIARMDIGTTHPERIDIGESMQP